MFRCESTIDMYRIFSSLFLLLTLISCKKHSTLQSDQGGQKISFATVNLVKIEQNAVALKGVERVFTKKEKSARSDLMKKQNEISSKYKALESKKSLLDKSSLEKKAAEIEQEMFNLQKEERDIAKIFEFVKYQISVELQNEIKKATREIAEQHEYSIVFTDNNLLYTDDLVNDITLEVLTKLNNSFKKVDTENYFSIAEKEISKTK